MRQIKESKHQLFWQTRRALGKPKENDFISKSKPKEPENRSHLAAIDYFGQNADVLDRPRLREPAERRVAPKRLDELHVEDGVGQHGHEAVHERQSKQEFEPAQVLSTQPQHHFLVVAGSVPPGPNTNRRDLHSHNKREGVSRVDLEYAGPCQWSR